MAILSGHQIAFTAQQHASAWEPFILQEEYLSANEGKFAERRPVFMLMVTRDDFSFAHEWRMQFGLRCIFN